MTSAIITYWDSDEAAQLLGQADAIELAAIIEEDDAAERTRDWHNADYFSVYAHIAGQGADCIADRPTAQEARALAELWSAEYGLPVWEY